MNKFKLLFYVILIITFKSAATEQKGLNDDFKLTTTQRFMIKQDLINFEGDYYHCPYAGKNGAITFGVGFTVSVIYDTGKGYNQTRLWSLKKINSYFAKAENVHPMSKREYSQLVLLRDRINNHLKHNGKSPFRKQVKSGVYCLNKNDGKAEMLRLLDYSIEDHVNRMINRANKLNIDLKSLDSLAIVMIVDAFYRGGTNIVLGDDNVTPMSNKALREKNYLELLKQIYAFSNGDKVRQNDVRNVYLVHQSLALLETNEERAAFKKFISKNKNALDVSSNVAWVLKKHPETLTDNVKEKVTQLAIEKEIPPLTMETPL